MIIINEKEYIEDILAEKIPVDNIYYILILLNKYYNQQGYKKKEIYDKLVDFLILHDEEEFNWMNALDRIIEKRNKQLIEIEYIPITKKELDVIKNIKNKRLERLLFTMLCICKYSNYINIKNNNWVNQNFKEIFKMANIKVTTENQCHLIYNLKELGLLKLSNKIDNLNLQVQIVDNDINSEVVLKITDYRNLGFQYLAYIEDGYIKCEICGCVVKKTGNKMKYCQECAYKKNIENTKKNKKV
jgi:hypothetical protein